MSKHQIFHVLSRRERAWEQSHQSILADTFVCRLGRGCCLRCGARGQGQPGLAPTTTMHHVGSVADCLHFNPLDSQLNESLQGLHRGSMSLQFSTFSIWQEFLKVENGQWMFCDIEVAFKHGPGAVARIHWLGES
jgi:hypothetical protein